MAKNVNSSKYRNIYQAKTTHLESRIDSKDSGLVAILKQDKLFPSSNNTNTEQEILSYLDIALENLSDGAETLLLNSVIVSLFLFFFLPMLQERHIKV